MEQDGIVGQAVKSLVQPARGDDRAVVGELGFAKHEGQNGNIQVGLGDAEDFPAIRGLPACAATEPLLQIELKAK